MDATAKLFLLSGCWIALALGALALYMAIPYKRWVERLPGAWGALLTAGVVLVVLAAAAMASLLSASALGLMR